MAITPKYDKTIAIIGSSSRTAEALLRFITLEERYRIISFSSDFTINDRFPITEFFNYGSLQLKETKEALIYLKPDIIINTAGLNLNQTADTEKKAAWNLNVAVVENLVKVARIIEAHFIMLSTDRVFDGVKGPYSETDKPLPVENFGRNKLAAENLAISGAEKVSIIRVSGIYGLSSVNKPDFVNVTLESLLAEMPISPDNNVRYTPINTLDLALVINKIAGKGKLGIYNAGSSDLVTDYTAAKTIAKVYNLDENLITPSEEKKPKACNYGLITLKTETDLGVKMPSYESSIVTYKTLSMGNKPIKLLI
jgi:dTDP-4-dehydrorhamnose reductase